MENSQLNKTLSWLVGATLTVLVLGLLTSPTLLALSHIFIAIPGLYFLSKADFKKFPKSAWALLAMSIVIILSVLFNQDIAIKGIKPVFKSKYFLIGFMSIAPFAWYFKNSLTAKKISYLLYGFLTVTSIVTLVGLSKIVDALLLEQTTQTRNAGVFGMLMNYAHNLTYFLIIVVGMVIYRKEIRNVINSKFLYLVLLINLVGLYTTYTRGAWIGFLAGLPFFFFKKNKKVFLGSFVIIAIFLGTAYTLAGRAMHRADGDTSRVGQWQAAVEAFKERPVLGYGYLNFEEHSVEIKKRYNLLSPDFKGHAHNNFFEMLGSAGALGVITFILWLGFWFVEMYKRNDLIGRIGMPFIVTFVVGGMTQSTISLGINLFFVMSVYAVCAAQNDTVAA